MTPGGWGFNFDIIAGDGSDLVLDLACAGAGGGP